MRVPLAWQQAGLGKGRGFDGNRAARDIKSLPLSRSFALDESKSCMEPRVLSEKTVELPGELAAEAGNTAMKSAEIAAKAPQFVRSDGLINLAG